jgi:hypothetical protein
VAAHTDAVHALSTLLAPVRTSAASMELADAPLHDPTLQALEAACGCLWKLAREPSSRAQVAQRPSVLVSLASAVRLAGSTGGPAVSALWGLTLDPAVAAAAAQHAPTLTALAAALASALAVTEAPPGTAAKVRACVGVGAAVLAAMVLDSSPPSDCVVFGLESPPERNGTTP